MHYELIACCKRSSCRTVLYKKKPLTQAYIYVYQHIYKEEGHWPWSAHLRLTFCVQLVDCIGV